MRKSTIIGAIVIAIIGAVIGVLLYPIFIDQFNDMVGRDMLLYVCERDPFSFPCWGRSYQILAFGAGGAIIGATIGALGEVIVKRILDKLAAS